MNYGLGLQFGHGGDAVENSTASVTSTRPRSFNSATAVMPWKTATFHRRASRERSFNSATAVMPWKTPCNADVTNAARKLQFGHGGDAVENARFPSCPMVLLASFNSATAVMPWKTYESMIRMRLAVWLQFGHGGDAVENVLAGVHVLVRPLGFNSATAVMPWKTAARGPTHAPCRRFNSATAVMPWKTIAAAHARGDMGGLQFGHGGDAVENLTIAPIPAPASCGFNSATAVMPWKTAPWAIPQQALRRASIRPRR